MADTYPKRRPRGIRLHPRRQLHIPVRLLPHILSRPPVNDLPLASNPFWEFVKGVVTPRPPPEQVSCHYPKPILLDTVCSMLLNAPA